MKRNIIKNIEGVRAALLLLEQDVYALDADESTATNEPNELTIDGTTYELDRHNDADDGDVVIFTDAALPGVETGVPYDVREDMVGLFIDTGEESHYLHDEEIRSAIRVYKPKSTLPFKGGDTVVFSGEPTYWSGDLTLGRAYVIREDSNSLFISDDVGEFVWVNSERAKHFKLATRTMTHDTPNQKRAELIAQAKRYVQVVRKKLNANFVIYKHEQRVEVIGTWIDGRTLRGAYEGSKEKVWNIHIAKAAAIHNALGINAEHSEYASAAQPTKVVTGMIVHVFESGEFSFEHRVHPHEVEVVDRDLAGEGGCWTAKITDDSNAHYEHEEETTW